MATDVILPALGMAQDTGKILRWLKAEGEQVAKGEALAEIETDKATVEIEAPADGVLAHVSAAAGDDVPVGQIIATILAPDAMPSASRPSIEATGQDAINRAPTAASPLASRIATEHNLDLNLVKSTGRRIQKADVLAYLQSQNNAAPTKTAARLLPASPKARRLAAEQGKDLAVIQGTGPGGAVLAADVLAATVEVPLANIRRGEGGVERMAGPLWQEVWGTPSPRWRLSSPAAGVAPSTEKPAAIVDATNELTLSNTWRIMAERTTQTWTSTPHFYLVREVNASRLIAWREQILKRGLEKVTYTDLLVKIVAAALRLHPRLNASWDQGKIVLKQEVHVGLAVAIEEGLVVPVIHQADTLRLDEIARQRMELVAKAQAGKLRPVDISDGTFTISNLGMYNVDAFNAVINSPQAAILAVGRIAERVVPINGQPAVQPMMVLTLSCDHRVVDGARGAQFLDTMATLIEEPLGLLS